MSYSKPYEEKEGDVSIFINDKEGKENRPDFTGYALVGPELKLRLEKETGLLKMSLSLWNKESGKLRFTGQIQQPWNGGDSSPRSKFDVPEVKQDDEFGF